MTGLKPPRSVTLTLEEGAVPLGPRGICASSLHVSTYDDSGAASPPTATADLDAANQRLGWDTTFGFPKYQWHRLTGPSWEAEFKACVLRHQPVVIGFVLPAGFPSVLKQWRYRWLDPTATLSSPKEYHAVLVCGYDDCERAFCVQDSQGEVFGECGKWWMGYRVADSPIVVNAIALRRRVGELPHAK